MIYANFGFVLHKSLVSVDVITRMHCRLTHTLETQAILRWTRCPRQISYTQNSNFTWTLLELQSSDNKKAAT